MSHKDKHHPTKKQQILARNKRHQMINELARLDAADRQVQAETNARTLESAVESTAAKGKDGEVIWSAKLQEVRNRVSGKRKMAAERWNRFSGTEGGGGRGR